MISYLMGTNLSFLSVVYFVCLCRITDMGYLRLSPSLSGSCFVVFPITTLVFLSFNSFFLGCSYVVLL